MTKILKYIAILLIIIDYAHSQELTLQETDSVFHSYLGISTDFLRVWQTGAVFNITDAYCFNKIPDTYGNGYSIGLFYKFKLSKGKDSYNSILFSLNYQNYNTKSGVGGDKFPSLKKSDSLPGEFEFVMTSTSMAAEIKYEYLSFDIMYSLKISNSFPLALQLGINLMSPVKTNLYQTYNLISDEPLQFSKVYNKDGTLKYKYINKDRTVVMYDDEIKKLNHIVFGIKALLSYQIEISDDMIFLPAIGYYFPSSRVVEDGNWRINFLSAGMSIIYRIK